MFLIGSASKFSWAVRFFFNNNNNIIIIIIIIIIINTRDAQVKTYYDINVVNCLTEETVRRANRNPDYATGVQLILDEAYRRKQTKHDADVRSIGGRFVAFVVSATGLWHEDSHRAALAIQIFVKPRRNLWGSRLKKAPSWGRLRFSERKLGYTERNSQQHYLHSPRNAAGMCPTGNRWFEEC